MYFFLALFISRSEEILLNTVSSNIEGFTDFLQSIGLVFV